MENKVPEFARVPHMLYDSLYIRAGARFPRFSYFFQKSVGSPITPLWWDAQQERQRDCKDISIQETNMQMLGALPMPEKFTVHDIALLLNPPPPDCLDHAKYTFNLGRRTVADGSVGLLPFLPGEHPLDYFDGRRPVLGGFNVPRGLDHKFYGFVIEPGLYFSFELRGGPAKLPQDMRLWVCLIGDWEGPADGVRKTPAKSGVSES